MGIVTSGKPITKDGLVKDIDCQIEKAKDEIRQLNPSGVARRKILLAAIQTLEEIKQGIEKGK